MIPPRRPAGPSARRPGAARSARRRPRGPSGSSSARRGLAPPRSRRRATDRDQIMSPTVPTTSTTITSGVRKMTSWPAGGSSPVTAAAPSASATTATATRSTSRRPGGRRRRDVPEPGFPAVPAVRAGGPDRVSHGRPPAGSRSGRRGPAGEGRAAPRPQAGLGPVEGHGEVGAHGRVGGLAARQVDRGRRVDGDDRDAGLPGAPDELDGRADRLAQLAADTGAQQRVDDDARPARRPGPGPPGPARQGRGSG